MRAIRVHHAVAAFLAVLLLSATVAPCKAEQAYVGVYIWDYRGNDELIQDMARLEITDLGQGRYGFYLNVINAGLCNRELQGQGEIRDGQGSFTDGETVIGVQMAGDRVLVREQPEVSYRDCPASGEYWREGVCPYLTIEEAISAIRSYYKYTNEHPDFYDEISLLLPGDFPQKGELRAWMLAEDYVKKVQAIWPGDQGRRVLECYYWDNQPVFCFDAQVRYDSSGEKTGVEENRYYLCHGAMVRWLDKDKQEKDPASPEFAQAREIILEEAGRLAKGALDKAQGK